MEDKGRSDAATEQTLQAQLRHKLSDAAAALAEHHDADAVKAALAKLTADDAPHKTEGGLLAQRVALGSLLRDGVPPPTFLPSPTHGERLFYEGHLFLFAGHKKAGKVVEL